MQIWQACAEFDKGPDSGKQADAVVACSRAYDATVRFNPVLAVALYSLGREDVLHNSTMEIVDYLDSEKLLDTRHAVLEIGCGIGRFLSALSPQFASLVGVDISPGMIAEAGSRCGNCRNVTVQQSDGRDFSALKSGSIDLVLAIDSFPDMVEQGDAIVAANFAGVQRVLRPAGRFVLINFSHRGDAYDRRKIRRLASEYGFRLRRSGDRPFYHWDGSVFDMESP